MKKLINYSTVGLLFFLAIICSSCEMMKDPEGNGNVTTERRSVQTFTDIDINGIFTVYLSQGSMFKLEVVTDDNLQDIVKTRTDNNVLYVSTDEDKEFNATRMDIYITVPDIERITLKGVNSFYCQDTLELNKVYITKENTGFMRFSSVLNYLSVQTSDVGDLELVGKAGKVDINNMMTGDLNAYGMKTPQMNLVHAGTGMVEIYVTSSLDVQLSGVGDVYCKGFPPSISKTGDGVGRLIMVN